MSVDNYSIVDTILDAVRDGLSPFVLRQYKQKHNREKYLTKLHAVLTQHTSASYDRFENEDQALEAVDALGWLKAVWHQKENFYHKLGIADHIKDPNARNGFNFVSELLNVRRRPAHRAPINVISDEEVYRVSDTATRLLKAIRAKNEAAAAEEIKLEFGRKIYIAEPSEPEPELEQTAPAETEDQVSEGQPAEDDSESSGISVDLSDLNLSGMDLRLRNLHLAVLQGADLRNSNLQNEYLANIDLSYAKVSNALFSEGNLCGSNLSHTDMTDTNLERTNLTHARMIKAKAINVNLRAAKLSHANLSGADLADADMSTPTWVLDYEDTISDVDGNLLDALLRDYGLSYVDFSDAKLTRAKMQRMFLERKVNLARADMTEANLYGARLVWANLTDATLHDANLSRCWIIHCNFAGAKMKGVDLTGAECYASTFVDAQMSGAKLLKFSYSIADLGEGIDDTWDNVDLSAADLCSAYLFGISLRNAKLKGAIFKSADLSRANLSFAELNETDFTDADLTGANFTGAKFYPLSTILPDGSYWDEDTDMTKFTGSLDDC